MTELMLYSYLLSGFIALMTFLLGFQALKGLLVWN